ncbi:hypothetical protein GGD67_002730 [Bradyrhizobium sp. IAR9]|uniref:hypothetical protein n=1 Tax=Bradyrhizobium sp. IAR9 TaxID=2663841 RepID=UPI0015CC74A2|nr:hypothetical protein [Bradyrhizobium sp. IAR9]NYG45272.1 hypothetical protein [Bradyrhizobium sp. IAR9]
MSLPDRHTSLEKRDGSKAGSVGLAWVPPCRPRSTPSALTASSMMPGRWVPALFAPAYVGGRTAAEHWDLTEQTFKRVVVITGRGLSQKASDATRIEFTLKHLGAEKIFRKESN